MINMATDWRLVISVTLVLFPLASVAVFTGPSDTTVLQGSTAVLNCSHPEFAGGLTLWIKDSAAIANQDGISFSSQGDYPGAAVIISSSIPTTRLDLVMPNVQVSYEGNYVCQMEPNIGDAQLTVQIEGATPTVTLTPPGSLTEGVQGELTCTATGYRPAVSLLWFRNGNPIQTGITETPSPTNADGATDSTSVWTFTPTRDYNEDAIECRTDVTNRIAPPQTGSYTLNVRYAPVVRVIYSNKAVVCSADSNPFANSYEIIFNKTQVVDEYDTSGKSYSFTPTTCTYISCNVTNTIGTGVGEVDDNPICPGYVDPTPPSTTTKAGPKPSIPGDNEPKGLSTGALVAIILCGILALALIIVVFVICYVKRMYCFASNKTKNETSPPKKQPSVANADMIRNQPEVRQSVHKYEDEPKKPRFPRGGNATDSNPTGVIPTGKRPPSPQAGKSNVPPIVTKDHRRNYPEDTHDGNAQFGRMNYADLQFQDQDKNGRGQSRPVKQPSEEPTQYASILV